MSYKELTPDDLATLYLNKPEERERIEQHIASLGEYQQGYFNYLLEEQEQLPFQSYAANNLHTKRDGRILWSDLYSFDSLVWHYQQQKEDLLNNSPTPNLSLFIGRAIVNAAAARTKLVESYNKSCSVENDDKYSLYVGAYDQFIRFLEKEIVALEKPAATEQIKVPGDARQSKLTLRALALYCYYLQGAGNMDAFENMEGGKEQALKRVAAEHGFASSSSWKALQQHYNTISQPRLGALERINPNHTRNLELAISMLDSYPVALEAAKREHKTATLKK
ncbi:hypothetical protein [Pontibacter actiniarum]|uniref:Uncharacterized protein n=1 Tax=Pontibacter actiniarum TaxID=323450 RepID=A0A1X9YVL3_9BACT|nr:hypothetical protein [Pontibacter actiniarum]ARS36804.1 hypothetical protein CA264_16010 [Pontibacter actiniarum]